MNKTSSFERHLTRENYRSLFKQALGGITVEVVDVDLNPTVRVAQGSASVEFTLDKLGLYYADESNKFYVEANDDEVSSADLYDMAVEAFLTQADAPAKKSKDDDLPEDEQAEADNLPEEFAREGGKKVKADNPPQLAKALEKAQEAFWYAVAEIFPEATTGDFPPDAQMAFDAACEQAIQTWASYNVPGFNLEIEDPGDMDLDTGPF